MILLIDNYDSFTYNVARYITELGFAIEVIRNDALSLNDIRAKKPAHIIISPGPCTPKEAGISNEVITEFAATIPILGVCLGHQCIGHVFGGVVTRATRPMHGKTSLSHHNGRGIFTNLPNPLRITRYHSLIVTDIPDCLEVTATTLEDEEVMAFAHRTYPLVGVQFHPEAVLTEHGHELFQNFLEGRFR